MSFPINCRESCRVVLKHKKRNFLKENFSSCRTSTSSTCIYFHSLVRKKQHDHSFENIKIKDSQKQNLKCESKNAEQSVSTVLFVIFRDNLIPIVWKSIVPMKVYEESRREQAQLHEELTQREEALGYTRIRNLHEVEELKRAQEMQIDEFFIHIFRESHATIVPSFGGMLSRDQVYDMIHGICLVHRETFLTVHVP